jgi:hypothetical protein
MPLNLNVGSTRPNCVCSCLSSRSQFFKKYENEFWFFLYSFFFARRTTSAIDLLCGCSITKTTSALDVDKWFLLPKTSEDLFQLDRKWWLCCVLLIHWLLCRWENMRVLLPAKSSSDRDYISQIIATLSFCVFRTRFYNWVEIASN